MQLQIKQFSCSNFTDPSSKINRVLLFSAFSFLFLGFKFGLIHYYGNATPFWDQWDAEAATLYKSWNDHTLTLKQLVEHHNEHRILTTRLLALLLISINKIWNPLLQMVVDAGLHLMAVLLLNALLIKVVDKYAEPALLAFSLLIFSIPFGWENTLVGFQGQFYFVLLFSVAAIWLLTVSEPLLAGWWWGVVMGVLAFLSLASGLFTFATAACIGILSYALKLRKNNKQLIATAILVILFIIGLKLTPVLPHQDQYKAHTFADFYHSLKLVLGWPVGENFLSLVVRNLPIGVFVLFMLKKRPAISDNRWFLFALCIWSMSQALSIAYGRAAGPLSSRYKDLHIIPVFINFTCLLSLAQTSVGKWRQYALISLSSWILITITATALNSFNYLPGELATKQQWNQAEERNIKKYIATGNIAFLQNKPEMDVPYPRPERLAEIIEIPGVRELLPANIRKPLSPVSVERTPENAFILNGFNKTAVKAKAPDTVWGSYNIHRDSAMGSISFRFKQQIIGTKIEIPVTGYPADAGMRLELLQNNQVEPLQSPYNLEELWGGTYCRINSRDYSIRVTDSSATSWLAIGQPVEFGRLDGITSRLLFNYHYFIIAGGVLIFLLITLAGISRISKDR